MNMQHFKDKSKVRQQTLQLVTQLARWCQVREDILYAFEKASASGLDEPMNTYIRQFLTRVQGGMDLDIALKLLSDSVEYEHFQDLIQALRFNFKYRGRLADFLDHMEIQLFKLEEEASQRKIASARDRRLSWLIVALGPVSLVLRITTDSQTRQLMLETKVGQMLLVICLFLLAAAAVGLLALQRKLNDI